MHGGLFTLYDLFLCVIDLRERPAMAAITRCARFSCAGIDLSSAAISVGYHRLGNNCPYFNSCDLLDFWMMHDLHQCITWKSYILLLPTYCYVTYIWFKLLERVVIELASKSSVQRFESCLGHISFFIFELVFKWARLFIPERFSTWLKI